MGFATIARSSVVACVLLLFNGVTSSVFGAQVEDRRQLELEADGLFKRILVKPSDLDVSFRYAEIETKLGDYEAAIGALERMLFYNTDLPRVRLELGVLYFRLGSYTTARTYFESAIVSPKTPDEVRARVGTFLREIDRRTKSNQSAFFIQTGTRFQTNANAGPNNATIRALGFDATLDSKFRRRADWNAFGQLSFTHIYDFENQRGDVWESNVAGYYSRQFSITRLDLGLLEVSTGPRLALLEDSGLSIHPYVLGNEVLLGAHQYFASLGGGAGVRWQAPYGVTVEPNFEYRDRTFANSSNYPTANLQTGHLDIASISLNSPTPLTNVSLQSRFSYTADTSRYRPYSYGQFGFEASLPIEFDAPFALDVRRWTLAPFLAYYRTGYRIADPLVDPQMRRRDSDYRVGATLDARLWQDFGVALSAQYQKTSSNLPNYRVDSFSVSVGPTARF